MKKDEQTGWLLIFSPFLWGGSDYTYPLPQVKVSFSLNNDIIGLAEYSYKP
jgi:hypothetical protein